jgi:glycosyltransferase involved in cell wall biosynthesis
MKFCFLGAFDPAYPRNAVIRKGLAALGDDIALFPFSPSLKAWVRYPALLARLAAASLSAGRQFKPLDPDCFFVPEFCHKDVPLARFLGSIRSKPVVFDPLAPRYETKILDRRRGSPSSLQAWWNFKIDEASFRLADLVLADTAAHKNYFIRGYGVPPEKIGVVPVGFDDGLFDPRRFPEPDRSGGRRFTVLFVGSFLPLHGVETIVAAARIVRDRDASVEFRFVGSGQTLNRAKTLASEIGAANCLFSPWAPYAELPRIIASAGICLGIFGRTGKARRVVPHKIYQAMGMGKPVITAASPAVREFFIHDETIVLCEEPRAETLAGAILELKKDEAKRDRIARNGERLVREKFSSRAVASKLKDLIASIRPYS